MNRRDFLTTIGRSAAGLGLARLGWAQTPRQPNIIVFLQRDYPRKAVSGHARGGGRPSS